MNHRMGRSSTKGLNRKGWMAPCFILFILFNMLYSCRQVPEPPRKDCRLSVDLTALEWKLWIDSSAIWQDDTLHLPPVDLQAIRVNPPGCGWEALYSEGRAVRIPATVEQYYWDQERDSTGTSGDYRGVSWFSTLVLVPEEYRGRRVLLHFESVRLRAEVFINEKLAGYDLIGNTPFTVDLTPFAAIGEVNRLAVRITDPSGNFDWADYHLDRWGGRYIPPSHGFGGVTGKVELYSTDSVSIADVFIMNTPEVTTIRAKVTLQNLSGSSTGGKLVARILEPATGRCLLEEQTEATVREGTGLLEMTLSLPGADQWSPDQPALYRLEAEWSGEDGSRDLWSGQFGFRWFEIRTIDGDRQFTLNGNRIFLTSAISWGFWPGNGMFPEGGMEYKQVEMARQLGLNMLNFHRAIGDPRTIEAADSAGLLIYEEPGGYRCPQDNIWFWDLTGDSSSITREEVALARDWRRIKLMRMVERDRNHPSLGIYSMQNEILYDPDSASISDMRTAHELDPTRIITYSSNSFQEPYMMGDYQGTCPEGPAPAKMYMEPLSPEIRYQGWWDQHFAAGPGIYIDREHYNHPGSYYHFSGNGNEIIFYGEDGAIGGPSRLLNIRGELESGHRLPGWDGSQYLASARSLDAFLSKNGFVSSTTSMDDYLISMGNVAYYYQGRVIENCRINNLVDGYVINGWENSKISNFSGMVDIFRNPKGDPRILAHYNQPSYIAVKLRNKVLPCGAGTMADIYVVNQEGFTGGGSLSLQVHRGQEEVTDMVLPVDLEGGSVFGQLVAEGVPVNPGNQHFTGYIHVTASVRLENGRTLTGRDELFMVDAGLPPSVDAEVYDESGLLVDYLKNGNSLKEYHGGVPGGKCLVLGAVENLRLVPGIENWIREGHTLLIVHDADRWMSYLAGLGTVGRHQRINLDSMWFGGHFFVREHPLFKDLPVNGAFNWEYQVLSRYTANRYSLLLDEVQAVVGAISREGPEIGTAVGIVPCGKGMIVFSTLDLLPNLHSGEDASVVARKVLHNYLKFVAE
jgi:hypothetical protein